MMEPVAWMLNGNPTADYNNVKFAEDVCGAKYEPLVRLSDAEARIKELEAQLDEALAGNVVPSSIWMRQMELTRETEARAEAAEALLKEQEAKIERLMLFGGRMANACYNVGHKAKPSYPDMVDLLFAQAEWDNAVRAARALKEKP